MEPYIRTLKLKRFRSVVSACFDFGNPTFLVGRNGSGKSNVIDALAFLSDALTNPLEVAFDARGGITSVRNKTAGPGYPPNFGISVDFGALPSARRHPNILSGSYGFEIRAKKNFTFEVTRERCVINLEEPFREFPNEKTSNARRLWFDIKKGVIESNIDILTQNIYKPPTESNSLSLSWLSSLFPFSAPFQLLRRIKRYSIDPSEMRRPQEPDSGITLAHDGANAASVLRALSRESPESARRLYQILGSITPSTTGIRTLRRGKQLTLEFEQQLAADRMLRFEAFSASDGTLRALGILLAVMQTSAASILLLEEPESSLHPGALDIILDMIKIASDRMQVVVTTHSPDSLDAKWIKPNNLRLVDWSSGSTTVNKISGRSTEALRKHLMTAGELLRSETLTEDEIVYGPSKEVELFS